MATGAGSLDLRLVIKRLGPRQTVVVDDLRVVNPRQVGRRFSNGCGYSKRGISRCSTLVGGAYGANTSPKRWEASIGRHLGVRRTYYGADQINGAVAIARRDLREGRVPWISFKAPHSWADMANGAGDAWARHLARRLATVKGPVWLAIHHEPENDGPIADWTAMQQRLAPLIRSKAPNVAYSIVLTGWNQVAGPRQFHLDSLWPDTTVDLVGFDIYNHYGSTKTGSTEHSPLRARYFRPLSRWAKAHGIAWGLAEAGYTDLAARNDPDWPVQTYRDLKDLGAVAFSYFNTPVNSSQTWPLNDAAKNAWFGRAVRSSPSL